MDYKIDCKTRVIRSGFDGDKCIVHARGCIDANGQFLATAQYLNVKGDDAFSELMVSRSIDGRLFEDFKPDDAFTRLDNGDGTYTLGCDATPMLHKKTSKVIVIGHTVTYLKNSLRPFPGKRSTFYAVFNDKTQKFDRMRLLKMPPENRFLSAGNGSGQSLELTNGDLIIPIYYKENLSDSKYISSAVHCGFDGQTLSFIGCGNALKIDEGEPRGVYEPSAVYFNGAFYMTLRADNYGYVSKAKDCMNYENPIVWRWDNGEILPNYNTQQHWMVCGGNLYLVYTRKAGTNDHVFRHRAPLFAAKVDTKNMCLIRESEFIAVPERGARLGNFGVFSRFENTAYVMAAEWMQPKGCEKYGSDNSIYLTEIFTAAIL